MYVLLAYTNVSEGFYQQQIANCKLNCVAITDFYTRLTHIDSDKYDSIHNRPCSTSKCIQLGLAQYNREVLLEKHYI